MWVATPTVLFVAMLYTTGSTEPTEVRVKQEPMSIVDCTKMRKTYEPPKGFVGPNGWEPYTKVVTNCSPVGVNP